MGALALVAWVALVPGLAWVAWVPGLAWAAWGPGCLCGGRGLALGAWPSVKIKILVA